MAMVPAGIRSDGLLHQSIVEGLATMTREDMHWLLSDWQAWETVMEQLCLERDEADALYYIVVRELMRREEGFWPSGNLSQEEMMFLREFPLRKHKLENTISELRSIADQVDRTHKMLTKTSLVASSSGAVSAVMTIMGVALAPVTTGGSLLLAAGQSLGLAAAATNILTSVLDNRSNSAARDRASRLASLPTDPEAGTREEMHSSKGIFVQRCVNALGSIRQLRAFQRAQTNPGFIERVRSFVATRRVPFWRATGVQRAAGAPALAMTCSARMLSVAGASFLLMHDLRSIQENWRHLEEGARTETAKELRMLAWELEQELDQRSQRYELTIQKLERSSSLNQERGRRARLPRMSGDANQLVRLAPAEAKFESSTRNRSACDGAPREDARDLQRFVVTPGDSRNTRDQTGFARDQLLCGGGQG
ncbi:apolipoprotein L5 isoform X1 [Myotis lucifugus]|uniref:apolipoprotein L5 isoform X1 n=2 Tax=Myotis lucifugus TaxID=59463 RepID=UPI000CCBDA6C|nr:apolipoprotein L5 isoform X1 [Myotis lucifugus]XP_023612991.1 apolipoprotein L5 isoform X1 [Myotis lucifugus]